MTAVGCCKGTGSCACIVQGAPDAACSPVEVTVPGAGTTGSPFLVTAELHLDRVFRLDGNEPWALGTEGGCEVVVPRCLYDATPSILMCNASAVLQGYAFQVLDCELGTAAWKYQAVDSTTVQTSLPAGWRPCCGQSGGYDWHPFYTDGADASTLVGFAFLRYDLEADSYAQRYVTLAGSITTTKPGTWEQGDCAVSSGGGGGGGGGSSFPDPLPGSIHLYLQSGLVLDDTKYPDWGQPGLANSQRWDALHLPPDYTGADWTRLVITVMNVTSPLTANLIVTLKDLTNTVDIATWTWPSGTAPISNALHADLTISSGSFTDWIKVQWHIENVQDGNAFGLHAEAFYEATAGFAS